MPRVIRNKYRNNRKNTGLKFKIRVKHWNKIGNNYRETSYQMLLKIYNKRKFRLSRNILDTKYVFIYHVIFDRDESCAVFISSPFRKRAENPGNEVELLILVSARSLLTVNDWRCSASGV